MNHRALLLASAALIASCAHRQVEAPNHFALDVPTSTVRIAVYDDTVPAVGRVGGVNGNQTNLSFLVAGVIRDVYVHIGDRVSSGQALATLDGKGYELTAAQARADVSVAVANAHAAGVDRFSTRIAVDESAVRRAMSLYAAGIAPHKDVDAANAQLAQDKADAAVSGDQSSSNQAAVESAKVHSALASRDLANVVLRAPEDGVVSAIMHRIGENVDPSMPVIVESPAQSSEVTFSVPASGLAGVRVGDEVQFSVIGSALRSRGTVAGVSTSIDPATQTGTVVARGLPVDAPIGSIVQAKIVIARLRGIVVPESALVQDPQTGNAVVFIVERGKDGSASFRQQIVNVQMRDGSTALIRYGLHVGQRVAARGGFTLLAPTVSGGD